MPKKKVEEDVRPVERIVDQHWRLTRVTDWMDREIRHMRHSVDDLKRAKQTFLEYIEENRASPTDTIGWFCNDMQNIMRNMRYDNAPLLAVDLHEYLEAQKAAKETA